MPRLAAQLFERGSDLFATTDEEGRLMTLNPAWEQILGWKTEEVEGKRFSEIVHPDEAAGVRAFSAERRVKGRTVVGIENRARHKNGGYRWINWSATSDGAHWYAIGRDVTARKEAEDRAQLFASLVELSQDFIAVAALDQSVLYVNAAGMRLVGLRDLDEARSKLISEFLTPEGLQASLETEQPAVVANGSWRGESTLRHFQTGEPIEVEINSFLVTDPQTGEPTALATVQRDIRERRRAEEQLARLADERGRLAVLVLQQAETERERISEALHDEVMQTLLVARQDLEEAIAGDTDAAPRALAALDQTTRELRGIIRGAHPQALAHGALHTALGGLARGLEDAGIDFHARVASGIPRRFNDVIYVITRELVGNALRHAGASAVSVEVERHNGEVVARICDDGRGLEPEEVQRAVAEGHIGIAASRERARAAGGRLEFTHRPDRGTEAVIVLPLDEDAEHGELD